MTKSKGHIGYLESNNKKYRYEYFIRNGELYRSPDYSPIDIDTKQRAGARWITAAHTLNETLNQLGLS